MKKLIEKNWHQLIQSCQVTDLSSVLKPLLDMTGKEKIKKNVLGMFLSKGFTKVRYAADVFEEGLRVLNQETLRKYKRFTPEEKRMVSEYVANNGGPDQCDWREATKLTHRPVGYEMQLKKRYLQSGWGMGDGGKKGFFTLEEDKYVLSSIL